MFFVRIGSFLLDRNVTMSGADLDSIFMFSPTVMSDIEKFEVPARFKSFEKRKLPGEAAVYCVFRHDVPFHLKLP